jgi:hypothetical protein
MDEPAAEPTERRYANHLRVGFNRLEFLLDFAQAYEGSGELVHAQLVAAPAHVKQFSVLLQGCVADYEQRYGPIPSGDHA